ncbi:hypothetical protein CC1G_11888 [Coprinopsis cinerea okayama7|uniref:Enoyl reductase (ER) domain-containing protein n=1 Tax=Coprinopsis cinerea (strain Okayama-7 / 130 / ATCC MYA-4618 / FGSC 9003) TaxID=240176 RepID=A8P3J8_COPC7|nr:hypothetical protein CC1G_11888 [Coprinopsis cinerea okayama7\|eukprot:XP_001838559.2 hypothetical protein CC1G_11888 [Coprinopsis cinerea okayama7\
MSQKALILDRQFGDFVLTTLPIPKPEREEVIVKIEASGLNPVDWKIQDTGLWVEKYPVVLGTDIAGEVVELGEGVTTVSKGDKVVLQGTIRKEDGSEAGFQQYCRADVHTLAKIPSNITVAEAGTLPVALTCAYVGLYNVNPHGRGFEPPLTSGRAKYVGVPLVVLGGASSVGQYVLQLASLSGFNPIITTASTKHTEFLKTLGATHVLDRSLSFEALQSAIKEITQSPIETVYDAISSAETQRAGHDLLVPGGQLLITLRPSIEASDSKTIIGVLGVKQLPHNVKLLRDFYSKLAEFLREGILKPNRVETLPNGLGGVNDGLQRLKHNKVSGIKLVALPQETP